MKKINSKNTKSVAIKKRPNKKSDFIIGTTTIAHDSVNLNSGWLLNSVEQIRECHLNVYNSEEYHAEILKSQIRQFLIGLIADSVILFFDVSVKQNVVTIGVTHKDWKIENLIYELKSSIDDIIYYFETKVKAKLFKQIDESAVKEIERIDNLKHQFVILRGIERGNRFFTTNHIRPERIWNGEVAYEILGYADTVGEAQKKLYDRTY